MVNVQKINFLTPKAVLLANKVLLTVNNACQPSNVQNAKKEASLFQLIKHLVTVLKEHF